MTEITAEPAMRAAAAGGPQALPAAWRAAAARGGTELRVFFRDRSTVGFIVALPAILLVLLASIFGSQRAAGGSGVTIGQLYTAGLIAGGIAATSFQYLGISVAIERESGILRRLSATPMPHVAYFAGKVLQVLVCAIAETALLLAVGVAFYHVSLPSQPGRWLTFAWVFLLGTAACAVAGIAVSSLPKRSAGAAPLISLLLTVLEFISGVFVVPLTSVPKPLRDVAAVFPLTWLAQGMRSVFLPAAAVHLEPAGSWEHPLIALVLLAWIAGGLAVCARMFRWQPRS
jgi:ABC-2 type transport system permease protein